MVLSPSSATRSPGSTPAYYGILARGAVVVPVAPMLVPDEVAFLVEDSGAKVALVADDLAGIVEGADVRALRFSEALAELRDDCLAPPAMRPSTGLFSRCLTTMKKRLNPPLPLPCGAQPSKGRADDPFRQVRNSSVRGRTLAGEVSPAGAFCFGAPGVGSWRCSRA